MMKKFLIPVMTLVMSASLALTGCSLIGGDDAGKAEDTVAVQSVSMLAGLDMGVQDRYSGVVVAQATKEVNKQEDRKIKELKVKVGDTVKKGDVLFTYDTEEMQLAIDKGKLELEKLKNTIDATKKQIDQLNKEKAKAKSEEQLSYSIEIQELEADNKENEYNLQTKTLEQEQLEKTIGNAEVTAPIDGLVQSINDENSSDSDDYDTSSSSNAYIVLMEIGNYRVKGVINEMSGMSMAGMEGSTVIIRSRVDSAQTWTGTMGKIDTDNPDKSSSGESYYGEESDEMSTTSKYPFYVNLENSDGLMMGQHVFIELDEGQLEKREGIWLSSEFVDAENSVVWAANDKDKLEKRTVKLGEHDEDLDEYQIVEGLAATDYVAVIDEDLTEGAPVTRYDEAYFEEEEGDLADEGEEDFDGAEDLGDEEAFEDIEVEEGGDVEEEFDDEGDPEGELDDEVEFDVDENMGVQQGFDVEEGFDGEEGMDGPEEEFEEGGFDDGMEENDGAMG